MAVIERKSWNESCRQIGQVLLHEWDPLAVDGIPEAVHEYDSYVMQVYSLLTNGGTVDQIFTFLRHVETELIGLDGEPDTTRKVAESLVQILPGI